MARQYHEILTRVIMLPALGRDSVCQHVPPPPKRSIIDVRTAPRMHVGNGFTMVVGRAMHGVGGVVRGAISMR
jgi:hypothetical protein